MENLLSKETNDFVNAIKAGNFEEATDMLLNDKEINIDPGVILYETQEAVIFTAISEKQVALFRALMNHKRFSKEFSATAIDSLGEPVLLRLFYTIMGDCDSKVEKDAMITLLEDAIDSNIFDLNQIDRNDDNLLQAMLQYGDKTFIPACIKLIKNEKVNITNINDLGLTAFGCALKGDLSRLSYMILEDRKDFTASQNDVKKLLKNLGYRYKD